MDFEGDTPNEAGGTHIGLFLGWAMLRGLASVEMAARLPALLSRTKTGRDLLFQHCDGKLSASDLSEGGSAFAESCYHAAYVPDYLRLFRIDADPADRLAEVPDDWTSQTSVAERLDRRYSEWRMSQGMPSMQVLHDALLAASAPVLEAAGFVAEPKSGFVADGVCTTFVHRGGWQTPRITVYGAAKPDQVFGVGVEVSFSVRELYDRVAEETQGEDVGWSRVSAATISMSMSSLAEGWDGPVASAAYLPCIWIFDVNGLAPAVAFLAARLRDVAIASLAGITSIRTLCDALDTRPFPASPWFGGWWGYGVPLAFEMCGHPSLGAVLQEMDAYWTQQSDFWGSKDMLAFVARVRARHM
jgi:hypothetical protein